MAYEGPKTLRGIENKIATGDGRKSWKKQANEAEEAFFGKKKKQGRKKKWTKEYLINLKGGWNRGMFGLDFDPITGEKYKTDAETIRSALTPVKKRKIKDAVGNKCEMRGCPNKAYQVHHIKQVKNRGANVGTNVGSNLIVLCANCHSDVHSGAITQTKLKEIVKKRTEKRKKEINKILRNRKKVGTEKSSSSTSQFPFLGGFW